jgi:hypothetical protein
MALKRLNNRHIKFAAGRVAGKTIRALALELGVSLAGAKEWSSDPLVKAKVQELAHLRDEHLLEKQVLTKDEALVTLSDVIRGAAVLGKFILPDGTLDIDRAKEEAPEVLSALSGVEPTRAGAKVRTRDLVACISEMARLQGWHEPEKHDVRQLTVVIDECAKDL